MCQKPPSRGLAPDPDPHPVPDPGPVPAAADKTKGTNHTTDLITSAVTATATDIRAASRTTTEGEAVAANSTTEAATITVIKNDKTTADTATAATASREMTDTTQRGEIRVGAVSTDAARTAAAAASGQRPASQWYQDQKNLKEFQRLLFHFI